MVSVLGINGYHGDAAACLVVDGKLVAAAEEERFRRIKHWAGFPVEAIAYCLAEGKLRLEDVEHVAINRDPKANWGERVRYLARSAAGGYAPSARSSAGSTPSACARARTPASAAGSMSEAQARGPRVARSSRFFGVWLSSTNSTTSTA